MLNLSLIAFSGMVKIPVHELKNPIDYLIFNEALCTLVAVSLEGAGSNSLSLSPAVLVFI